MRILIDFHVVATGRPKGHQFAKKLYGAVTAEFDIEVNNEPMIKVIEGEYSKRNFTYYQNGDGCFYVKSEFKRDILDNDHIKCFYADKLNPFGNELRNGDNYTLTRMTATEAANSWYPKNAKTNVTYPGDRQMLDLLNDDIHDLRFVNYEEAKNSIENEIREAIICDGSIYKRVPEPVLILTLVSFKDSDPTVRIQAHLPKNLKESIQDNRKWSQQYLDRTSYTIVQTSNINDIAYIQNQAVELASKFDAKLDNSSPTDLSVEQYFPISTHGDDMILYFTICTMRDCLAKELLSKPGAIEKTSNFLASWPAEAFEAFKKLNSLVNDQRWFDKIDEVSDVIDLCYDIDQKSNRALFTNPTYGVDFELLREQLQLRTISLPGLGL